MHEAKRPRLKGQEARSRVGGTSNKPLDHRASAPSPYKGVRGTG